MLPGNMQYRRPDDDIRDIGTKEIQIDEPIHFAGPRPDAPLNLATANLAT